jgi:CheY-like chemotaxis protein
MGNLIEDLLAFSRIGQSDIKRMEVNLDQLVHETLSDFKEQTEKRNIAWEIRPLPAVWGDRALLRMMLVNLMSNAVKFTAARAEAKIEIGCAPGSEAETVIFIRDNGAGFDPKYTGKLFCAFQRLHSQDQFEGTGIGLANVQRIIHRHGGRTWAEGVVNGGATFYFSLPKQSGARLPMNRRASPEMKKPDFKRPEALSPKGKGWEMKSPLHILHLEDDPNDAALVQSTLKTGGVVCATTWVQNRNDFVAALEQGGIDLILSDSSLPAFDGLSAVEIVRTQCPTIPLILVSGTLDEEMAIESLKNGATDYVLKERLARLAPAVRRAMREVEERAEHRRLEAQYKEVQ